MSRSAPLPYLMNRKSDFHFAERLGREVLQREFNLLELPVRLGGMAFRDPVKTAAENYKVSKSATTLLQNSIITGRDLDVYDHMDFVSKELEKAKNFRNVNEDIKSEALIEGLPGKQRAVLNRIIQGKASGWLSVMPKAIDGFDLSAQQFRDRLSIRYGKAPIGLPKECDGCD